MDLRMKAMLAAGYTSHAQQARVLTENWLLDNMYCPRCGSSSLAHFPNNQPVADFYCPHCHNQYELKSKQGALGHKISDGAYATMIERIMSNTNPDLFIMSYSRQNLAVDNLYVVPKYFFVPAVIEKRKPLGPQARRAGWVGCSIRLDMIPVQGRIPVIREGQIAKQEDVIKGIQSSERLAVGDMQARGWLFDVLQCMNFIETDAFSLQEMYDFEAKLAEAHPDNHNIRAKIRQQLQVLRDKGFVEFLGNGKYCKLKP